MRLDKVELLTAFFAAGPKTDLKLTDLELFHPWVRESQNMANSLIYIVKVGVL